MRALPIVVSMLLCGVAAAQPAPAPAGDAPSQPTAPPPGDPNASMAMAPPTGPMLPPTAPPRVRHGLFGGVGLFGGNISCDGSDCGGFREAGGAAFQLGYLFTPKLGLLFDFWAMTSSKNDVSVSFLTSTLNVRYYPLPALWVQAGAGSGHAIVRVSIFSSRSDDVPVGQFAVGYELVRGRQWAIDAAFRVAQGKATDKGAMSDDDAATGRSLGVGAHFTYFAMR